jgi:hypothetical protein
MPPLLSLYLNGISTNCVAMLPSRRTQFVFDYTGVHGHKTVIEHVMGELVSKDNPNKRYTPKLKLTITEMYADEKAEPIARAIARNELAPMSGMVIEDGNYTLRYTFDGQQQEHDVRVESGTMLAA